MKKAAIYARVSTELQGREDKVSIEVQLAESEAYANQKGYTVVARFVDKEKYRVKGKLVQPSGQRKDRPGYVALLKAARVGHFDVIVAWKEDRLYRGMYAAMPISELLDEKGKALDIELVKETFDRKMLGIKAALGKIESDNIKDRMIMGRKARLGKGLAPGGEEKYGYKRVEDHLELEETEAGIVKKVFAWYVAEENIAEIRRRLNALGVTPRRAKYWSRWTIFKILKTEAYATGKLSSVLDGEKFYTPCPPIINMETWQKAQKVKAKNKFKPRNLKRDYLCHGLVYCVCRWKSSTKAIVRPSGKIAGYYYCHHSGMYPETCPEDCYRHINSDKLDEMTWDYLKLICKEPAVLKDKIDQKLKALKEEQGDYQAEINRLQAKLDDLLMERQQIITWGRKNIITEIDMELQLDAIGLQELTYKKELDETLAASEAQKQIEDLQAWADEYLSDIRGGIEELDIGPETLNEEEIEALYTALEAWRFEGNKLEQLKRAILEKKRQTVKALISKIVIGKLPGSKKGKRIQYFLTLEVPVNGISLLPDALETDTKEIHFLSLNFVSEELIYRL